MISAQWEKRAGDRQSERGGLRHDSEKVTQGITQGIQAPFSMVAELGESPHEILYMKDHQALRDSQDKFPVRVG